MMQQRENETGDTHNGVRVGDILRKERVTKRIAIETIARDLKLNVKYIKALEENRYDDMPAEPYIRVYLRSISKYLTLDDEELLRKFCEERGVPQQENASKETIRITSVEKETNYVPWIIIALIIAVLATVSIVSKRMGWVAQERPAATETPAGGARDEVPDSLFAGFDDSLVEYEEAFAPEQGSSPEGKGPVALRLTIRALRDSVWVRVVADGRSWRNFLSAGSARAGRTFAARREIYARIGDNSRTAFTLNGEELDVPGTGVVMFKVDTLGMTMLNSRQWERMLRAD